MIKGTLGKMPFYCTWSWCPLDGGYFEADVVIGTRIAIRDNISMSFEAPREDPATFIIATLEALGATIDCAEATKGGK